jgi:hypothetical protein
MIDLHLQSESVLMTVAQARIGVVVVSGIRSVHVMWCLLRADTRQLVRLRWGCPGGAA